MDIWSGVIGAVFGAIITGLITMSINRSRVYADIISTSRNEWINLWRDEISKFLSISDMLRYEFNYDCKNKDYSCGKSVDREMYLKLLNEYHISKNKILMRLNLDETIHQEIYVLINKIAYEKNIDNDEYFKLKEGLLSASRILLKEEWERVKNEARSK